MADDNKVQKSPVVVPITAIAIFENYESLTVVDIGQNGFNLLDANGNSAYWPSGTPFNDSGPIAKLGRKISIIPSANGALNATAVVYY